MWLTLFKIALGIVLTQSQEIPTVQLGTGPLELHQVQDQGRKVGAFIVKATKDNYEKAVEKFYANAPKCIAKEKSLPTLEMSDGSFRTTYATETSGLSDTNFDCLSSELKVMNKVFDQVDDIVSTLIQSLTGPLSYFDHHHEFGLEESPSKVHVHVYTSNSTGTKNIYDDDDMMVPYHVDNGIYLIITSFPGHGLKIKNSNGNEISTDKLAPNDILVLMGRGLTDWLLKDHPAKNLFHPVPHAVGSMTGKNSQRSILARMKIPTSENAVKNNLQFKKVFYNRDLPERLCLKDIDSKTVVKRDDSSHHAKKTKEMCKEGEAFCWMNCLPLPDPFCTSSHNLICTNNEDQQCFDDSMDTTCEWKCNGTAPQPQSEFCKRGTDMLMQGFETTSGPSNLCIILFFKAWTLDTAGKYAFGCIGVAFLGFAIEALIALRRRISSRRGFVIRLTPIARRILVVTLFGLNLIGGYLAMLVAMTYSIELFACVVLGLCLGHLVFNTKSAVGESIDPCCASQQGGSTMAVSNNALNGTSNHVPLTRTPCDLEGQIDSSDDEEPEPAAQSAANVKCCSSNGIQSTTSENEEKRPPSYTQCTT